MLLVKDVLPAWISYTLQNGNTLFFIKSVFPSSTASMLSLGFYSKKSPWEEKNVGKSMWSPASLKTEIKMALKKRNGLEKDVIFVLKIKFIDMAYKKKTVLKVIWAFEILFILSKLLTLLCTPPFYLRPLFSATYWNQTGFEKCPAFRELLL